MTAIELKELPKEHLSYSAITTFIRCGHQYRLRYWDGRKGPVGSSLVLGSAIHGALEYASKEQLRTGARPPSAELVEYVRGILAIEVAQAEARSGFPVDWKEGKGLEWAKLMVANGVTAYEDTVGKTLKPVLVEHGFTIGFQNVEYKLVGFLDIWDADSVVWDIKTSQKKMSPMTAVMSDQLTGYQIGLEEEGRIPAGLGIQAIILKAKGAEVQVIGDPANPGKPCKPRTRAQLQDYLTNVNTVALSIKAGLYPKANDFRVCSWCEYRMECHPEWFPAGTAEGGDE
jgi:CRISPR/Cas system-associated exonuclease Cas4 (RecB family)